MPHQFLWPVFHGQYSIDTQDRSSYTPTVKNNTLSIRAELVGLKGVTNIGAVLALVQGSTKGISTTELKEKAGLTERQTWGIVTRAAKEGKIRKVKRGVYAAV